MTTYTDLLPQVSKWVDTKNGVVDRKIFFDPDICAPHRASRDCASAWRRRKTSK